MGSCPARKNSATESRGMAIIFIILAILGLGLVGGMVAINVKSQKDEQALNFTVSKMKKIAYAISTSVYDPQGQIPRHFEDDMAALPVTLSSLVFQTSPTCSLSSATGKLSGWCGPYWNYTFSGENIAQDGWGTNFSFTTSPRRIRSFGPNTTDDSGGADDLDQLY